MRQHDNLLSVDGRISRGEKNFLHDLSLISFLFVFKTMTRRGQQYTRTRTQSCI